jgi:hypothetical protein
MKYFIRAFFGGWVETTKEHYEEFRTNILDGALNIDKSNPEKVEAFLSKHSKEVA